MLLLFCIELRAVQERLWIPLETVMDFTAHLTADNHDRFGCEFNSLNAKVNVRQSTRNSKSDAVLKYQFFFLSFATRSLCALQTERFMQNKGK